MNSNLEENQIISKEYPSMNPPKIVKKSTKNFITPEELSFRFQLLQNPEQQENESKRLAKYLKKNPFRDEYNPELIFSLMNFFDPNSKFGNDGVNNALRIINSLFKYNEKHHISKNSILFNLMNQPFYMQIWPYFLRSKYAISIFGSILAIQRPKSHKHHKNKIESGPIQMKAIDFLIQVNIFEEIKKSLVPNFQYLGKVISLFQKFRLYDEVYDNFKSDFVSIVDTICNLTFSASSNDYNYYGYKCLGNFGESYAEIGKQIISNKNFQDTYSKIETLDENSASWILDMIDDILLNKEKLDRENRMDYPGSLIRNHFLPINPLILNSLFKLISMPDRKPDFLIRLLSVFSHLHLTEEDVNVCIRTGFCQHIFELISGDFAFKVKKIAITALCLLVSCGNQESVQFFIDNSFIEIISNFIDDLMNDIPYEIIEALDKIVYLSETNQEQCLQWSIMVFDNENIVDSLEKASKDEYYFQEDFENYDVAISQHSYALLMRKDYIDEIAAL